MTTTPSDPENPVDPHAAKISPDDPRLRLAAPRGRTLKKGPAIALVVLLGGTLTASLVVALLPNARGTATKKSDAESQTASPTPVVPESIRNAPDALDAPDRARTRRRPSASDRGRLTDGGLADDELPPPSFDRHERDGRDPRVEEDLRARAAGILFEGSRQSTAPPPSPSPSASTAAPSPKGHDTPPAGSDADPNLQGRKNAFLDSEGAAKTSDVLQARVQHPRTPYEVQAGTIVPAVLITALNSDLPGPVIGQVRENVYDTVSGNHLLIPQGSRLLAYYDSMVAWGQERVLVCWNRLVFPNGDSIHLDCMPAADLTGAAGITDDVDEHWGRILKGATVATLLAATTAAVAGNTEGLNPTVPQAAARGGAAQIMQVGQQLVGRNMSIQPTITVRPGFSVNVMITKDLVFQAPYRS